MHYIPEKHSGNRKKLLIFEKNLKKVFKLKNEGLVKIKISCCIFSGKIRIEKLSFYDL